MVKDNTSEIGSLNKAPHFANIDRAEAHVRCIIGDLELRPAEKRARQARTQEYFSGARAVNREGEGKSFRRKRIQKCTKNKVWPDPIWTVKQLLSELHKFDNVLSLVGTFIEVFMQRCPGLTPSDSSRAFSLVKMTKAADISDTSNQNTYCRKWCSSVSDYIWWSFLKMVNFLMFTGVSSCLKGLKCFICSLHMYYSPLLA